MTDPILRHRRELAEQGQELTPDEVEDCIQVLIHE
jgi:hypothetical protein